MPANTYTLTSNFQVTNTGCPLQTLTLVSATDGSAQDLLAGNVASDQVRVEIKAIPEPEVPEPASNTTNTTSSDNSTSSEEEQDKSEASQSE